MNRSRTFFCAKTKLRLEQTMAFVLAILSLRRFSTALSAVRQPASLTKLDFSTINKNRINEF